MKNTIKIILIVVACLSVKVASAQFRIGITGGVGGATQSAIGNVYDNDDVLIGFNTGLFARNYFAENFSLKTSLLYAAKGRTFNIKQNGEFSEQKNKLSYLVIPFEVEHYIPLEKDKLFVGAGPYTGILLYANQKLNGIRTKINDEIDDFDFGLTFEMGYSTIIFSKTELQLSISYDMGLSKIADYDNDFRNKSLVFNVGILL
ncbi:porin family protein [Maribellus sp. YY47]|uniref:porin family protein n=1 Tax=Maribellus sp. YY47 TaxID=2929486 RepID=UPI002001929D|nr:porin family protein [Maribellus sp. YY47]MCK3683085.1 PorT family protein [Maribellus sp. YY47]